MEIIERYKDVNIYISQDTFLLMYSNSKSDNKTTLKRCKSLTSAKAWITRNKRYYYSYELDHYTRERKDIYHTTTFY